MNKMSKSNYTAKQIISKLREAEVMISQGITVPGVAQGIASISCMFQVIIRSSKASKHHKHSL